MAEPEWGTKRVCPSCAARFYDLMNDPMTCPKCGGEFTVESFDAPKGKSSFATESKKSRKAATEEEDEDLGDDLLDDDDDDVSIDDDDVLDDDDDDTVSLDELKENSSDGDDD
ncbi:TIGR02300 family protein [Paracoccaceae bacterium GXU_MW_L88]